MGELKKIISEYVDIPAEQIDENMSLKGDIGVDSFGMISMLVEIEETYGVEIPEVKLSSFQTITDLYEYISSPEAKTA